MRHLLVIDSEHLELQDSIGVGRQDLAQSVLAVCVSTQLEMNVYVLGQVTLILSPRVILPNASFQHRITPRLPSLNDLGDFLAKDES